MYPKYVLDGRENDASDSFQIPQCAISENLKSSANKMFFSVDY